ncbi:MAG: DUF2490 domain-containing protein [Bacteroidales bacterium]
MNKKIIRLLLFLVLPVASYSQETDFRTWYEFELEGEVFNLVDFSVSPGVRLWDNSTRLESILGSTDVSVPVTKFLRLGVRYRYEMDYKREDYTRYKHRYGLYAELDYRIERLRMAYRAIYQNEYTNFNRSEDGRIPETQHRHKVSFKYRRKGWDIAPLLAAEMFFTVRPKDISYQWRLRIITGVQYRLTKDINISLQYRYQQEYYENNPLTSHILCTGIEYEL